MIEGIIYTLKVRGDRVYLIEVGYKSWFLYPKDKEEWSTFFEACLDYFLPKCMFCEERLKPMFGYFGTDPLTGRECLARAKCCGMEYGLERPTRPS